MRNSNPGPERNPRNPRYSDSIFYGGSNGAVYFFLQISPPPGKFAWKWPYLRCRFDRFSRMRFETDMCEQITSCRILFLFWRKINNIVRIYIKFAVERALVRRNWRRFSYILDWVKTRHIKKVSKTSNV